MESSVCGRRTESNGQGVLEGARLVRVLGPAITDALCVVLQTGPLTGVVWSPAFRQLPCLLLSPDGCICAVLTAALRHQLTVYFQTHY